jgi:subtilase family serine protease
MKQSPPTSTDVARPLPPFDRRLERPRASRHKALFAAFTLVLAAGCAASGSGSLTPHGRVADNIGRALPGVSPTPVPADQANCDGPGKGAGCHVKRNPAIGPSRTPAFGLSAMQLRSAYGLPPASGSATPAGPLIAIVDAFDDPSAEADLGVYRQQYGLPPCTAKNGCFTKVILKALKGAPPPPPGTGGPKGDGATWADEIALDLAMASAACPSCQLLLVESAGEDLDSLASAVNAAASYNPVAISNSWGVSEGDGNAANIDPDAQAAFNHPGIAITASAGDIAGQVQFPASSPYVTAVGGTKLVADATSPRGWSESVWEHGGFGCSSMFAAPAWQSASGCAGSRSVADVSMIADYDPGVAVYSSAEHGWVVLGGTSVGAPFVAGLYAAANDYGAATSGAAKLSANASSLNAVSGPAGATLGSPNGLAAF